ncbi:MAG: VWA domain-containing protein [Planctomycetota bacterium]
MRRTLILTLLLVSGGGWGASGGERRPLDLPSGGAGRSSEEEDAPETIIFFGAAYEGDGFFFLLDKSGSMAGEKIMLLKEELTSTINSLSSHSDFAIVAFSGDVISFSPVPSRAEPQQKAAAIGWVQGLEPYGPTFMLNGALYLLPITRLCNLPRRVIIAVGDGLPNGPGPDDTLEGIVSANWEGLPINTILFGSEPTAVEFMSNLSAATGGTFHNNP